MREPTFWRETDPKARTAAPVTRALLTPLAALYARSVRRRIETTTPYKCGVPVICVGNLTVGGVGKTPIIDALRERVSALGLRAASLSRGYGGRLKTPTRVDTSTHKASDVGDEPLMLAASGEAWIGPKRDVAARAMVDAGVEVILMDDGHQNPQLHKDLSIVAFDGADPIGNGHIVPKGPLREPVPAGLSRAEVVVIVGPKQDHPSWPLIDRGIAHHDLPVLHARLRPRAPSPPGPLVAFAGIGNPVKFFDGLRNAGGDVVETVPFPDHHPYRPGDITYLKTLATEREARLITTEKDYVRLTPDQRENVLAFPVEMTFEETDLLDRLLKSALGETP